MTSLHVRVRELPPAIRAGLELVGYACADIRVTVAERFSSACSGDGVRAFVVACPLGGGSPRVTWGSWGGSNMFVRTAVDDVGAGDIPPGFAVLVGTSGGSTYATLYLRPENVTAMLPAGPTLSERMGAILAAFAGLTSAGRKDYAERHGRDGKGWTPAELDTLVAGGFLKRNAAGAVSVTTEGKNAAAVCAPRGWSTCYDLPVDGVSWASWLEAEHARYREAAARAAAQLPQGGAS